VQCVADGKITTSSLMNRGVHRWDGIVLLSKAPERDTEGNTVPEHRVIAEKNAV
jgi:hypothetical protein